MVLGEIRARFIVVRLRLILWGLSVTCLDVDLAGWRVSEMTVELVKSEGRDFIRTIGYCGGVFIYVGDRFERWEEEGSSVVIIVECVFQLFF